MKNVRYFATGVVLVMVIGAYFQLSADTDRQSAANENEAVKQNAAQTILQKESTKKPDKDLQLRQFMRLKLQASNLILDGLVTEDFKKIQEGANQLSKMSAAEKWRASHDPMYLQHSGDFRRLVDKLKKKAAIDNLEACALVWLDVTMSCLECHEFVRSILITEGKQEHFEQLSLFTPAQLRERKAN